MTEPQALQVPAVVCLRDAHEIHAMEVLKHAQGVVDVAGRSGVRIGWSGNSASSRPESGSQSRI